MLTKTLSEAKKKQRNILIKAMNNDIGSIDSAKDSWNPAQISERAKDISYIRSLVDTWNPAQLNEALRMLDLPIIDTWNPAQIEEQRRNLVFYLVERTLTGNPITLNIIGNLTPEVTGLKVSMSPIQDFNGYDHPWVGGAGNNKCPIRASGAPGNIYNVGYLLPVSEGDTVYCYFEYTYSDSADMFGALFSDSSETNKTNGTNLGTLQSENVRSFNITSSGFFGVCYSSGVATYTITKAMISKSSITQYEPYENKCPITGRSEVTFTRTAGEDVETKTHTYTNPIYAGVDDFVNGGASSSMAMIDLGDVNWSYYTGGTNPVFIGSIPTPKIYEADKAPNALSSIYYVGSNCNNRSTLAQNLPDNSFSFISTYGDMVIRNSSYTDATAFKTAMDGVQLCYELATPTTITTSAEEITLLKGTNVLSTDGNSIELKYKQNF